MLKPYWNNIDKNWNIIEESGKIISLETLDKMDCQDFCDIQNRLDEPCFYLGNDF